MEIVAASGLPAFLILLQGLLLFPLLYLNKCSPMIAQKFWLLFSKKEFLNPRLGRESLGNHEKVRLQIICMRYSEGHKKFFVFVFFSLLLLTNFGSYLKIYSLRV